MSCKSFKPELFYTLPLCGVVFGLVCTSLITSQWVVGEGTLSEGTDGTLTFNYGLFKGYKKRVVGSTSEASNLAVVCQSGQCMYSCGGDNASDDIQDILGECPWTNQLGDRRFCDVEPNASVAKDCASDLESNNAFNSSTPGARDVNESLFGVGLYVAAVVFLILGLLVTLGAGVLGVFNAFSNPIEWYTGVHGLIALHGVAALLYFLVICLYGGLYDQELKHDAPISEVIRFDYNNNWTSDQGSSLGYSYWLVFVCFILHLASIGLVAFFIYKKYKPKRRVVEVTTDRGRDQNTMLF